MAEVLSHTGLYKKQTSKSIPMHLNKEPGNLLIRMRLILESTDQLLALAL